MKKNTKSRGPGRPQFVPTLPKGKFTFTDLELANGVNPKTGKGKDCTTLTLRKWLKRELNKRGHSAIVHLKDVLADPNGKHGLGRKQYVYTRRAGVSVKASAPAHAPKATKATKATRKTRKVAPVAAPIAVDSVSPATQDYEAKKAELLAPVVSIAPAPMVVAPPALVDKTDAAPAPEAEQAPVPVAAEDQESPEEITAETIQPEITEEPTVSMEEETAPANVPVPVPAPSLVG